MHKFLFYNLLFYYLLYLDIQETFVYVLEHLLMLLNLYIFYLFCQHHTTVSHCIHNYSIPDRQTDILLTEIKVITYLFVIVIREIYVHVYTRLLFC